MREGLILATAALVGACAANQPEGAAAVAAVDDFVAATELERTDRIERITPLSSWKALNDRYVVFHNHDGDYLLYFKSRCYEAAQARFSHKLRFAGKRLQIPYDRFGRCQIETIYRLGEGQADELYNLGDILPSADEQ